jgi:hypothetical protein
MRSKGREMEKLSWAYHRYLDLDSETEASGRRMTYLIGLLGPDRVEEMMAVDEGACLRETLEAHPSSPRELREKLSVWRAVREYLRVVPGQCKVGDIQAFLSWLGMRNVTRQAIESALKRHSDWFNVTKKGHERYVELK